jgi:hypothetical protein
VTESSEVPLEEGGPGILGEESGGESNEPERLIDRGRVGEFACCIGPLGAVRQGSNGAEITFPVPGKFAGRR